MEFDRSDLKRIGVLIKDARNERPQSWLAKILGTKASAISNIENGRRPVPKNKVEKLAGVLGLEPAQLMPSRRIIKELKDFSVAFRGVETLPKEALEQLEKQYLKIKRHTIKQPAVKAQPAEMALEVWKRCGVVKPPIDLEKVCQAYGIDVEYSNSISFPGLVFKKKKIIGITIDSKMNDSRKRFTLAHEIGHVVLKHLSDEVKSTLECKEVGLAKNDKEKEADEFASHLLMPEKWIREATEGEIRGVETVLTISSFFDVSRQAAARRLVELSEGRCAAVFSEEGSIKWGVASPRLGAWIKRGTKLAKGTQAFRLLSEPLAGKKPVTTKPDYWLDGHFSGKFKEHSTVIYSKNSSILTLIWAC